MAEDFLKPSRPLEPSNIYKKVKALSKVSKNTTIQILQNGSVSILCACELFKQFTGVGTGGGYGGTLLPPRILKVNDPPSIESVITSPPHPLE